MTRRSSYKECHQSCGATLKAPEHEQAEQDLCLGPEHFTLAADAGWTTKHSHSFYYYFLVVLTMQVFFTDVLPFIENFKNQSTSTATHSFCLLSSKCMDYCIWTVGLDDLEGLVQP